METFRPLPIFQYRLAISYSLSGRSNLNMEEWSPSSVDVKQKPTIGFGFSGRGIGVSFESTAGEVPSLFTVEVYGLAISPQTARLFKCIGHSDDPNREPSVHVAFSIGELPANIDVLFSKALATNSFRSILAEKI